MHGLGGDRTRTWTKTETDSNHASCFWPEALLSKDLPTARIITWGYAAQSIKPFDIVSIANPTQHAQTLCSELSALREDVQDRPIMFVAHSMGGIIVKKALLQSRESNDSCITAIAADARGVVFMGTPHNGSKHADVATCFLKIIKLVHSDNPTLVAGLKSQDSVLQELDHAFHQLLRKRHGTATTVEVRCFFETLPMSNAIGIVVPDHSAAPPAYELPVAVDANHVNMTKFSGSEDQTYKNVVAELRRMIKLAKERSAAASTGASSQPSTVHYGNNDRGALANYADQVFKGNSGGSIHYGQ